MAVNRDWVARAKRNYSERCPLRINAQTTNGIEKVAYVDLPRRQKYKALWVYGYAIRTDEPQQGETQNQVMLVSAIIFISICYAYVISQVKEIKHW